MTVSHLGLLNLPFLAHLAPDRAIQPAISTIQPSISPVPRIALAQSINPCYPSPRMLALSLEVAGSSPHLMRPRPVVLQKTPATPASSPVARPSSTLPFLSFQPLTTIKFGNSHVLITIRNGRERTYPLPCPTARQRPTSASPLECAVTQSRLVTPLECAVPSEHRALPGFGRSCPSVSSLESAVAKYPFVSPLECAVTKNWGGTPAAVQNAGHRARDKGDEAACFFLFFHL